MHQLCGLLSQSAWKSRRVAQIASSHIREQSLSSVVEYLLVSASQLRQSSVQSLLLRRPALVPLQHKENSSPIRWIAVRDGVNIDSTTIDFFFLGRNQVSDSETVDKWQTVLESRLQMVDNAVSGAGANFITCNHYQRELDIAASIVSRSSYTSRSLQQRRHVRQNKLDKVDTSPVTVVDFGVQACVLHTLHSAFPGDTFIAEEDSSHIRGKPDIVRDVIDFVHATLGGKRWTEEQLFHTIDLGTSDERKTQPSRAWVLDPIDGTKGFIRGEHFCISLGLLDYPAPLKSRKPVLSVLGCPNLSWKRIQHAMMQSSLPQNHQSKSSPKSDIQRDLPKFHPPHQISTGSPGHELQVFDSDSGSLFFAVRDMGAYGKSLDMAVGLGSECRVSTVDRPHDVHLCESREAIAKYSRSITAGVRAELGMQTDYVQLDGQCKHCLVGAGVVDGSLRLPPKGYIEKIWDHLPGCHFIEEAGGRVTDLSGSSLDFGAASDSSCSRNAKDLCAEVEGVIVSNGLVHDRLVRAVSNARKALL